jgi:hypothetical protein
MISAAIGGITGSSLALFTKLCAVSDMFFSP